jgi:hypothetical protein
MIYSEDFKQRVKAAYPKDTYLHVLLDEGAVGVGCWLDDGSCGGIDPVIVLNCAPSYVTDMARRLLVKKDLCLEWHRLYQKQNQLQATRLAQGFTV